MTVAQLIESLAAYEPTRVVVLSSDPEGNNFALLDDAFEKVEAGLTGDLEINDVEEDQSVLILYPS